MNTTDIIYKLKTIAVFRIVLPIIRIGRIYKFKFLSTCKNVKGKPNLRQPLLTTGIGTIMIGKGVNIGVSLSPGSLNTYAYLDVRKKESKIVIGDEVWINNNACIISEGPGITIGNKTLIGMNFCAFDSDFHELAAGKRIGGTPTTAAVNIGKNVFMGSNVTVLKGVTIGNNTVIGSGSVVVNTIPENVIAAGNPCKVIRAL